MYENLSTGIIFCQLSKASKQPQSYCLAVSEQWVTALMKLSSVWL